MTIPAIAPAPMPFDGGETSELSEEDVIEVDELVVVVVSGTVFRICKLCIRIVSVYKYYHYPIGDIPDMSSNYMLGCWRTRDRDQNLPVRIHHTIRVYELGVGRGRGTEEGD